jgi:hypothetical protein
MLEWEVCACSRAAVKSETRWPLAEIVIAEMEMAEIRTNLKMS